MMGRLTGSVDVLIAYHGSGGGIVVTTEKKISVLLATDGSPESLAAAEWLNQWANPERTRVTLITVITPPTAAWSGMGGYVLAADMYEKTYREIEDSERSEAQNILNETRVQLTKSFSIEQVVLVGQPSRALVEYAEKHDIHLIVMGRRGHSALGNLIGSVSFGVLQRSPVPVTIVS